MKILKKNNFSKLLILTLVCLLVIPVVPALARAGQAPVNLGSTASYAVLAGSTITNTGTTTINGDAGGNIGLHPGTIFTGQSSATISGTVHLADSAALQAKNDLIIAYDDAMGRTPVTRIPSELGGTTLTPGTYDSADGTFQITGTLTLDAQGDPDGVFVFKTASTLITASASNVNLINSARFCRTFFAVGSSATLGTNSHFAGHILAMESITANTGASVQGQLLARSGAVTLDNNTIMNGLCAAAPVVTPVVTPTPAVGAPVIHITKTPDPLKLTHGKGSVTYTYKVTNPGTLDLGSVKITDNKISNVSYISGDTNLDNLLQSGEIWVYTGKMTLTKTTTNIATATGIANSITARDTATATVRVTNTTVMGGLLPKTGSPLYNVLFVGVILTLAGVFGLRSRKNYE